MFDKLSQLDFSRPWLGLLILLPLLLPLLSNLFKTKKPAVIFSDIRQIVVTPTWRTKTIFLPSVFACVAWICLTVALMGPRLGREETKVTTEGIAIGMVLDVSGSMADKDMRTEEGTFITRYETVEKVFTDFIQGNEEKELEGRSNDMVSITVFGKYVDNLCPLTLDHDFTTSLMKDSIRKTKLDFDKAMEYRDRFGHHRFRDMMSKQNPIWEGTVIYDAVALSAQTINNADDALKDSQAKGTSNYKIKSKVLIVLSDGQDQGSHETAEFAAKVAKEFGIKVYTIAIHGQATNRDSFGRVLINIDQQYDNAPLKMISKETGGKFYKASDPQTLFNIMQDIEQLEKTEIPMQLTMDFVPKHRPWIFAGLIFLSLFLILKNSLYREAP